MAIKTLTGQVLEAVGAASFPLPVGDVQTDGHGPADGRVAVGRNPHAQQTLGRRHRGVSITSRLRLGQCPQTIHQHQRCLFMSVMSVS